MFEFAQLNLFTPEVRKGGGEPLAIDRHVLAGAGTGRMEFAGRTRAWTPTWSAIMEMGGFDPSAANRGAYAGLVHGITSRPKPKPNVPATPATRGPLQPHPPNHRDAVAKALG